MALAGWGVAAWVVGGVVVLLAVLILVPHNLRVRRVRQAYRALPPGVADRILGMIGAYPPDLADGQADEDDEPNGALSVPSLLREFGHEGAARVTADLLQRANLSLEAGTRTLTFGTDGDSYALAAFTLTLTPR